MNFLVDKVWLRHAFIIIGIIILTQICAFGFRCLAKEKGAKILEPLSKNSQLLQDGIINLSSLDSQSLEKILNLNLRIGNKKESHKQAFLVIYPYHFASSSLLLILSSISIVVIFLAVQNGINNTNPYFKSTFFTLAAITSFYGLSPLVYKQDINISTNLTKFILYDNLQEEIYNYSVSSPNVNSLNDTLSINEFHSLITRKMSEINSVNLEFDYKVIPNPDFGLNEKK